jgi:NitT/TauT family transport system substrate-binding protein
VLSRGLELAGLRPTDVIPVHLEVDEHERALIEKRVDAVVTYEPVRSRLLAAGARPLFDSRQIPGEIVDVLVTRAATVEKRASAVEALVSGWFRAAGQLAAQPDSAAQALSQRMRLPPSKVREAFAGIRLADLSENLRLLQGDPPPLRATAQRLLDVMTSAGLLDAPPDLSALFDSRIVARIPKTDGG